MKKEIRINIKPEDIKVRNELHFNVQKSTRANVFKDKTKYTRKKKHKDNLYC